MSECVIYAASLIASAPGRPAYPRIWNGTRMVRASRHFYERERGPIPKGHVLRHTCREPLCINSEHMEPVKRPEQVRQGRTKLTAADAAAIRESSMSRADVASRYGVSLWMVSAIRAGRRWAVARG